MYRQDILDRVVAFCDVRGDAFYWRTEPRCWELFRIFQDSQNGPCVSADEIHEYVREHMEPLARWDIPMQERIADICTAWADWDYAVQNYSGLFVGGRS